VSLAGVVAGGPLLLAVPVALAAGAVTFVSPCCLPLVPGCLAYVTSMSADDDREHARPGNKADREAVVPAAGRAGRRSAAGGDVRAGVVTVHRSDLQAVLSLGFTAGTAGRGAFLAFTYSLGLGVPFLITAAARQHATRMLGLARRHARLMALLGGGLLAALGLLELTGAHTTLITWLQPTG
jgi:cytochrome c-type biogenesis protein